MLLIILFMGIHPVIASNVAPALSDPKLTEQTLYVIKPFQAIVFDIKINPSINRVNPKYAENKDGKK